MFTIVSLPINTAILDGVTAGLNSSGQLQVIGVATGFGPITVSGVAAGDILMYDATNVWKNKWNVTIATPAAGDVITYSSNKWQNKPASSIMSKSFAPANPASTTSNTATMCGCAMQFTPAKSGNVWIRLAFTFASPTGGGYSNASWTYGTGTPPINGAAVTGTAINTPVGHYGAPGSNGTLFCGGALSLTSAQSPYAIEIWFSLWGLTPSTAYWLDLIEQAPSSGSDSCVITNVVASVIEIG